MDDAVGVFEKVGVGGGLEHVALFPLDGGGPGRRVRGGGYGGPGGGAGARDGGYVPGATCSRFADSGAWKAFCF